MASVPASSKAIRPDEEGRSSAPRREGTPAGHSALGWVLLLGAMWGTSYVLTKVALEGFDTWEITFLRLLVAALVLAFAARGEPPVARPVGGAVWGGLIALAIAGTVLPVMLITWSITSVPTSTAAISNATTPLLTAAIAIAIGRERRPTGIRLGGTLMGFIGVGLMFGLGFSGGDPAARLALLLAAFGYACGFVIAGQPSFRRLPLSWLATRQMLIAAAVLLPAALIAGLDDPPHVTLGSLAALLALGAFSTGIPALVQIRTVRRFGSSSASLATYVVPIVGSAIGFLCLGEQIGLMALVGGAVTIGGIVVAERGRR